MALDLLATFGVWLFGLVFVIGVAVIFTTEGLESLIKKFRRTPRAELRGVVAGAASTFESEDSEWAIGKVKLRGELWNARCRLPHKDAIRVDDIVEIVDVDGLWLTVQPRRRAGAEG